jgi:hypothetical protein
MPGGRRGEGGEAADLKVLVGPASKASLYGAFRKLFRNNFILAEIDLYNGIANWPHEWPAVKA